MFIKGKKKKKGNSPRAFPTRSRHRVIVRTARSLFTGDKCIDTPGSVVGANAFVGIRLLLLLRRRCRRCRRSRRRSRWCHTRQEGLREERPRRVCVQQFFLDARAHLVDDGILVEKVDLLLGWVHVYIHMLRCNVEGEVDKRMGALQHIQVAERKKKCF